MLKNKLKFLPIILGIITAIISILPIISSSPLGIFYNFEPDIVYTANAISYTNAHNIRYIDHPATPTIWLIAKSFIPLRLYAKYIDHTPFIEWTILNQPFLYQYGRLFQALLLASATTIFLLAIKKVTSSSKLVFLAWLALLTFGHFPYIGSTIASEGLSFLILSLWFMVFTGFLKNHNRNLLLILGFLAGLSIANKFTNLFYAVTSCALVLSISKPTLKTIRQGFITGLFVIAGFIFGTWPIKHSYRGGLFNWVIQLATHSGLHGVGDQAIFSLSTYLQSAKLLFRSEFYPTLIILTTISILIFKLISRKIKINSPSTVLSISMLAGVLIFAKYPLSHYQLPNFYGLIFTACILTSSFKKTHLLYLAFPVLIFAGSKNVQSYYSGLSSSIAGTINFENYLLDHPAKAATVWEFASVKDYTLIHTRDWMMDDIIYSDALRKLRPDLLELSGKNFSQVKIAYNEFKPLYDVCWDKLYIQQVNLPAFLDSHPEDFLKVSILNNTGPRQMALIESTHCLK